MKYKKLMTTNEVLGLLGERIKATRVKKAMTQGEFAKVANVTLLTIHNAEAGKVIRTDTLINIIRALGALDNIDNLIPEPSLSISQMEKIEKIQTEKVRVRKKSNE